MAQQTTRSDNLIANRSDDTSPIVLVIDDDAEVRDLLVYQLGQSGYRAVTAGTGISGIRAARACSPAIIVLDLNLPDMHGLDVLRVVRSEPMLADIPVVVVSGEQPYIAAQALVEGADALLRKPLDFDDLIAAFQNLETVASTLTR